MIVLLGVAFFLQSNETRSSVSNMVTAAAEECLGQALPSISRGSGERGQVSEDGSWIKTDGNTKDQAIEEDTYLMTAARALTDMSLPVVAVNSRQPQGEDPVPPETAQIPEETVEDGENQTGEQNPPDGTPPAETDDPAKKPEEETSVEVTDSVKKPAVLIYHTHATESYQPVSVGNFHSVDKEGTVRQVGDAMAKRLEDLGYAVIHDETIHDNPSYNQSYSRSLETAKAYVNKYPDLKLVVDLHRDAAGYAGSVGKTAVIDGKTVATYGYVIGQGNPNVAQLTQTVSDLNQAAETIYPGFTGKVIEKAYKFNQYISDHHVLIEVGNNENTIEQAKLTGRYLADIIAAYLKDAQ